MPQHQEYKKKKVVAYLDFATIPSINMVLHLIEHYDKEDADRILGLSRFELSDDVLKEVSKRGEVVFSIYQFEWI